MKNNLHSKISKIVDHAVYESGAGNDVLISNDVDNILALIKKYEREVIGKFEHRIHKLRAMIPLTGGMPARNEAKDILDLLAKLKEVT